MGDRGESDSIAAAKKCYRRDLGSIYVKQKNKICIAAAITNRFDIVAVRKVAKGLQKILLRRNPTYLEGWKISPIYSQAFNWFRMLEFEVGFISRQF